MCNHALECTRAGSVRSAGTRETGSTEGSLRCRSHKSLPFDPGSVCAHSGPLNILLLGPDSDRRTPRSGSLASILPHRILRACPYHRQMAFQDITRPSAINHLGQDPVSDSSALGLPYTHAIPLHSVGYAGRRGFRDRKSLYAGPPESDPRALAMAGLPRSRRL